MPALGKAESRFPEHPELLLFPRRLEIIRPSGSRNSGRPRWPLRTSACTLSSMFALKGPAKKTRCWRLTSPELSPRSRNRAAGRSGSFIMSFRFPSIVWLPPMVLPQNTMTSSLVSFGSRVDTYFWLASGSASIWAISGKPTLSMVGSAVPNSRLKPESRAPRHLWRMSPA